MVHMRLEYARNHPKSTFFKKFQSSLRLFFFEIEYNNHVSNTLMWSPLDIFHVFLKIWVNIHRSMVFIRLEYAKIIGKSCYKDQVSHQSTAFRNRSHIVFLVNPSRSAFEEPLELSMVFNPDPSQLSLSYILL